ncbi:HNH endonuclease signature motif containing protein [Mycobacterium gordonae]|uniref:HNH endonuclease signature motif containing protein n=1 Tax=Mycobacterium gordonae TaxID=1778 RepID=UPI0009F17A23
MIEMRWCGEQYPDWHADSEGPVYRCGVEVKPYPIDKYHRYPRVWANGRQVKVHTLVCTAFYGPRPDGMECRHLNDVKSDNRAVNLCWGTMSENHEDAVRNGLRHPLRGERHGRAKLSDDDVRVIRRDYAEGHCSQDVLANRYGVSQRLISGIVRRETWIHVADDELLAAWKRGAPDIVSAANF